MKDNIKDYAIKLFNGQISSALGFLLVSIVTNYKFDLATSVAVGLGLALNCIANCKSACKK